MNNILNGFKSEIEKHAGRVMSTSLAMDLGGLGILGAPAASHLMTGKKPDDRVTSAAEVGGLGLLGAAAIKGAKEHAGMFEGLRNIAGKVIKKAV